MPSLRTRTRRSCLHRRAKATERLASAALHSTWQMPCVAFGVPPRIALPRHSLPVQIIGAGVGGMPYALREAGFFRWVASMRDSVDARAAHAGGD